MSLLSGYNVLSRSPGLRMGGTTQSGDRANFSKTGAMRNRFQVFAQFNATPSGYEPPYSWVPAQIGGGLATFTSLTASVTEGVDMSGGVNLTVDATGSISTTLANLDLVVALAAAMSSALSTTNANLIGTLSMLADLSASIATTTANMGAIVEAAAALSAAISINSNMTGLAHMSADILPYTELSPESLSRAVWDALLEGDHDAAGIMRILLSHAAGDATVPSNGGGYEFMADDGVTPRIQGSISGDTRTVTLVDGTE